MQYQKQMDEVRANLGDLAEAGKTMNMKFNMINHVLSSGIATTADEVIAAADNLVKHCREDYEKVQQKAKDDLAAVALANTATAEA